jgi:hypothetical protein
MDERSTVVLGAIDDGAVRAAVTALLRAVAERAAPS